MTSDLLKVIYYSIFNSYMTHASQVWVSCKNRVSTQIRKSKKIIKTIKCKDFLESSNPLRK